MRHQSLKLYWKGHPTGKKEGFEIVVPRQLKVSAAPFWRRVRTRLYARHHMSGIMQALRVQDTIVYQQDNGANDNNNGAVCTCSRDNACLAGWLVAVIYHVLQRGVASIIKIDIINIIVSVHIYR